MRGFCSQGLTACTMTIPICEHTACNGPPSLALYGLQVLLLKPSASHFDAALEEMRRANRMCSFQDNLLLKQLRCVPWQGFKAPHALLMLSHEVAGAAHTSCSTP